jgi:hypothetical protein
MNAMHRDTQAKTRAHLNIQTKAMAMKAKEKKEECSGT